MVMRFMATWSAIGRQNPAEGASGELDPCWCLPDLQGPIRGRSGRG